MFNNKTLLVVGAGASSEAGLPTGHKLKNSIIRILDIRFVDGNRQESGDFDVCQSLRIYAESQDVGRGNINPYLDAAWRIRDALPQAISIDSFIDVHSGDNKIELCGKIAITRSILKAERKSHLYFNKHDDDAHPNYNALEKSWYGSFIKLLTEGCTQREIGSRFESIALIIFNYDRCVEHFLYHSLQNIYGIKGNEAAELIKKIEIYHPYGTVGYLPWQQQNRSIDYGEDPNPQQLLELASQIKTFTEGTDKYLSEIDKIRWDLLSAKIVVFLGFAFHKLNMDLLKPENSEKINVSNTKYYATAKGISDSDCEIILGDLMNLCGVKSQHIFLRNDRECSSLFLEYWRSLSLS